MVDVIVVFLLFVFCISGFSRGILGELWALAALVISTFVTGRFYLSLVAFVAQFIHGETASNLVSFALLYGVISALMNGPIYAIVRRARDIWQDEAKSASDRLAAAVLGIIEGIGALQVMAAVLLAYPALGWDGWIKASALIRVYVTQWPFMIALLPREFQHVIEMLR